MGVDCKITLPNSARLRDIANALGILAGLPVKLRNIPGSDGVFIDVEGVKTNPSTIPECAEIDLKGAMVDGFSHHHVLYHFEWEGRGGGDIRTGQTRGIMPRSTPFWIAVAKKLVMHFGGDVDYSDCDSSECDLSYPENPLNGAVNGRAWDEHQRSIFALAPVNEADMQEAAQYAAYK